MPRRTGHLARATLSSLLTPIRRRKTHVLLAANPKSASTFLQLAIAALPGMSRQSLAAGTAELDTLRLLYSDACAYVTKTHAAYEPGFAETLRDFPMTPVVLVRNFADALVSYREHVRREPLAMARWLDPRHLALDDDALDVVLADTAIPRWIDFVMTWRRCPDALWIDYDEVRTTPESVLRRVAAAGGIAATDDAITAAVGFANATAANNRRIGVAGRGSTLSAQARQRLEAYQHHYPMIDFARPATSVHEVLQFAEEPAARIRRRQS